MLTKKDLLPFKHDIEGAAKTFGVSERTIRRWLKKLDIYEPREGYGPGKVDIERAAEIRRLYEEGHTQAELGKMYGITQAMIGRIVNNLAYRVDLRLTGSADHRLL